VRRSRTEQLTLVPASGGAPITLFHSERKAGLVTTQDVFQVSPDGAYLAYASDGALHVRAADGTERVIPGFTGDGLMRFAPRGELLAVVLGERSEKSAQRIVVFDLGTGATRELATFSSVRQLEWIRDGLVAQEWSQAGQRQTLIALPLAGEPRTLLERPARDALLFATAATGTRVVAFDADDTAVHILDLDAAAPGEPRELGVVHDQVTNAAASLDGERISFTTQLAVFTIRGAERPVAISARDFIHSLWYARDGRLGYAAPGSATILDGHGSQRFDAEGPQMLRFDPRSGAALIATGAHAWEVAGATPRRLATAESGTEIIGVDRFADGLVLWTTGSREAM
jgi:hypothetical protein